MGKITIDGYPSDGTKPECLAWVGKIRLVFESLMEQLEAEINSSE